LAWDNLISRTIWLFLQPGNLLVILLVIATFLIWKGRRKTGLSILISCMVIYILVMFGPLTNWLMVPLEKRFAVYTNDDRHGPYSGIIVLAGAERIRYSSSHQQVTLDGAGERLIEAARLARKFPSLPVIFCGGGKINGMTSEVDIARKFFLSAGIDLNRIRFDNKSYNSHTNAIEAKKRIRPDETGKWLLVTSAFHMPRAVGAFRHAGVAIQPFPVDYRTDFNDPFLHKPNFSRNLYQLDYAVHEWVGMLAYYIGGYSDSLYPAP